MEGRPNPVTILVCGILSLVLCGLFTGIPAWVMGNNALNMASSYPESDLSMIKVGRILGIIGTVLSGIGCCIQILALMMAGGAAGMNRRSTMIAPAAHVQTFSPPTAGVVFEFSAAKVG